MRMYYCAHKHEVRAPFVRGVGWAWALTLVSLRGYANWCKRPYRTAGASYVPVRDQVRVLTLQPSPFVSRLAPCEVAPVLANVVRTLVTESPRKRTGSRSRTHAVVGRNQNHAIRQHLRAKSDLQSIVYGHRSLYRLRELFTCSLHKCRTDLEQLSRKLV